MDPTGAAALIALLTNGGPWAVVVVVLGLVLRVWRSGEFISKAVHDTIVAATTQRYLDLLDRFNNQQEAIKLWREQADRAAKNAEQGQAQHADLRRDVEQLRRELEELRDDLRAPGPAGPAGGGRRPDAREGA